MDGQSVIQAKGEATVFVDDTKLVRISHSIKNEDKVTPKDSGRRLYETERKGAK